MYVFTPSSFAGREMENESHIKDIEKFYSGEYPRGVMGVYFLITKTVIIGKDIQKQVMMKRYPKKSETTSDFVFLKKLHFNRKLNHK